MSISTPGTESMRLHIAVDFPWDATACMGTGAYSETMVRALAQAAPQCTLTLIVYGDDKRRIDAPNVQYRKVPPVDTYQEGPRHVALPSLIHELKADCLFAPATLLPAIKVCPYVATIHDLTFLTRPEYYGSGLLTYLKKWFPPSLRTADALVAISDEARRDLVRIPEASGKRIDVIEQPVRDTFFHPLSSKEAIRRQRALGVSPPFFFHVSNLGPHKNLEFALDVFSTFLKRNPGAGHQFVFAGGSHAPNQPPNVHEIASRLGIADQVMYVGRPDDDTLKALYQGCEAFLFPSLAEGWGLPVVEAGILGAKTLASVHVPSVPAGDRLPLSRDAWISRLNDTARAAACVPPDALTAGRRLLSVLSGVVGKGPSAVSATIRDKTPDDPPPSVPAMRSTVAIRGDWHSPSGIGQAARNIARALMSQGVRPLFIPARKDALQESALWTEPLSSEASNADLWIHVLPPDWITIDREGCHVATFFWEATRLPETSGNGREVKDILADLDEIWTPSSFLAEALSEEVEASKVVVSPLPIDTDSFRPGVRRLRVPDLPPGFDATWTVFLYVGTWDPRKRPDILIRSFGKTFSRRDHALLLVKSYVTGQTGTDGRVLRVWLNESSPGTAHVRIVPGVLSETDLVSLFQSATVFTTASRGEGFCLPAVQAMSCGKPVLSVNATAFKDFAQIPVNYRWERVPPQVRLPGYSSNHEWAAIDEKDLCRKLRWIHEHRDEVSRLGQDARRWVLDHASLQVVGRRLGSRIKELLNTGRSSGSLSGARR